MFVFVIKTHDARSHCSALGGPVMWRSITFCLYSHVVQDGRPVVLAMADDLSWPWLRPWGPAGSDHCVSITCKCKTSLVPSLPLSFPSELILLIQVINHIAVVGGQSILGKAIHYALHDCSNHPVANIIFSRTRSFLLFLHSRNVLEAGHCSPYYHRAISTGVNYIKGLPEERLGLIWLH